METNNQNLSPEPIAPNSQIPSILPHSKPPSPPKLPVPPLPPEKTDNINYTEPGMAMKKNKKTILFVAALVIVSLFVYGFVIIKTLHKDASDIHVSADRVNLILGKSSVSARLAPQKKVSFLINGGKMLSLNTGEYGVIPMEKVKYLEQKYSDFIHCGSPGEAEGKNSIISTSIIANSSSAERAMRKIDDLVKKGNLVIIEFDGSKLEQIQGLEAERTHSGIFVYEKVLPSAFYLIDDVRIVKEKYQ